MARILLIDDDAAQEALVENLHFRGYDIQRFSTARQVIESIDSILTYDLIILDILMDYPKDPIEFDVSIPSGIHNVGMYLYRYIRDKNKNIPILVFSGCSDKEIVDIIRDDKCASFLSKWSMPSGRDLCEIIESLIGSKPITPKHNVFIVHGRDEKIKYSVKNYLQNTLNLGEPIILHEKPNLGRTIIEKFEDYAFQSNIVFVILTPDDEFTDKNADNDEKRRSRQNVIFEMGYFLGVLGRETGRVILLHVGPIDLPSDLSGVVYINITNGVEEAGEEIRTELENVKQKSQDW